MPEKLYELEMRVVYGRTLSELADENPDIVVVEADLSKSSGTCPAFLNKHPDKFINVGVAEANMLGISAGLALEGKIPFCATFTLFATRRACDQIAISVAYAKTNVKITGTAPGITAGHNGGTHMCFEDIAIMRAVPDMVVLAPCDVYELRSCVRWMAGYKGPVYMQMSRMKQPGILDENYQFNPHVAVKLHEGKDVTLVSTGYMTQFAKQAVNELSAEGISVDLLHYPCLKPFDTATLIKSVKKTGRAVTLENHNIIGGLGSAVCEVLSESLPSPVRRIGVPDKFGEIGTEDYLFNKFGIGIKDIKNACRKSKG